MEDKEYKFVFKGKRVKLHVSIHLQVLSSKYNYEYNFYPEEYFCCFTKIEAVEIQTDVIPLHLLNICRIICKYSNNLYF